MLTAKFKADKIFTIFEHEATELLPNPVDVLFWREHCGYVQLWTYSGIVYDVIKRDEIRYMYE